MQFKLISILATALTVQSAYAMSATQQGQAMEQSEQSEQSKQVHQLEELAHHIHVQQMTELHQLDISLLAPNATSITSTLNSVANVFTTTGNAISNITSVTLAQQLPNIISSLNALAANLVTNTGSIITTPVTYTFNQADQLAIYNAFNTVVQANTQLINSFVGPNGLLTLSSLRGPVNVILNLIERTVVTLAGAIIARIPAYAGPAQNLLNQIHASLGLTINV